MPSLPQRPLAPTHHVASVEADRLDAPTLAVLRDALVPLCLGAGAAIRQHYLPHLEALEAGRVDLEVLRKADDSPLTAGDLASHAVLAAGLQVLTPGVPVVSEESQAPREAHAAAGELFWLVDPLDGTKEFLKGNGEFTVNVALVARGEPVLGVVHAPEVGATYLGARGLGAWKMGAEPGSWRPIRAASSQGEAPLRVVASRSHRGAQVDALLKAIEASGRTVEAVSMGSSLKLCLVAEGVADLYPRLGPTMWWDTAAAQAVVEAAGGTVRRLDGAPLRYADPLAKLLNPHFVVAGQPAFPWERFALDLPPA